MALTKLTKNLIDGTFGTEWVSSIQTSNFTAEAAKGYFVNTTSAAITVTLPVGVVGIEIVIQDYAGTFATNKVVFASNGSEKIQGSTDDFKCSINNATVTLIYQDATKGWTADNIVTNAVPLVVSYLVLAGGGGSGSGYAGVGGAGGGAGGLRSSYGSTGGGPAWANENTFSLVQSTNYTITIGAGGATAPMVTNGRGVSGSNSEFNTITSVGGGSGTSYINGNVGGSSQSGGSGGGGTYQNITAGSAVSSPVVHGYNGGAGTIANPAYGGGGGGGAGGLGAAGTSSTGGNGGLGLQVNIDNNNYYYAGGGGGGADGTPGSGGSGVGGNGAVANTIGYNATPYRGSGGGGAGTSSTGGNGSGGVVILRYPSTYTISGLSGSTITSGTDKITTFNSGTGNIQFN